VIRTAFALCLALAVVCAAAAGWEVRGREVLGRIPIPARSEHVLGALALALAFTALAASVALIDAKVGDPDGTETAAVEVAAAADAGKPTPGPILDYELDSSDLGNFSGKVRVEDGQVDKRLCLVTYFDKARQLGRGRSYKWWTPCKQRKPLKTLDAVHDSLALPEDWGPRTTRAVACVPPDSLMPHVRGKTSPKLSDDTGDELSGGATQLRVIRFDTRWIMRYDRINPDRGRLPPLGDPCSKEGG
jgi:hypothetical protein